MSEGELPEQDPAGDPPTAPRSPDEALTSSFEPPRSIPAGDGGGGGAGLEEPTTAVAAEPGPVTPEVAESMGPDGPPPPPVSPRGDDAAAPEQATAAEGDVLPPAASWDAPAPRARIVWISLDRDALASVEAAWAVVCRAHEVGGPAHESRSNEGQGPRADETPSHEGSAPAASKRSLADEGRLDRDGSPDTPRVQGDEAAAHAAPLSVDPERPNAESSLAPSSQEARHEGKTSEDPQVGEDVEPSGVPVGGARARGLDPRDQDDDRADLAVFPFFVDERPLGGMLGLFDWRAAGRFTRLVDAEGDQAGEVGHALLTLGGATLPARRVVLVGLGATSTFDEVAGEAAAARIGDIVRELRPRSVLFGASTAAAMRDGLDAFLRRLVGAADATPVVWLVCVEPRALTRLRRRLEADPTA